MVSPPSDPRRDLAADPDDPEAAARHRAALRRSDPEAHFAVIACVHGNLPALEAVFADIDRREIPRVVCLGDIIGYGPNPAECVDLVFERCDWSLKGRWEDLLLQGPASWRTFNRRFQGIATQLEKCLRPGWFTGRSARARWQTIESLKTVRTEGLFQFVSGSLRSPTGDFILPQSPDDPNLLAEFDLVHRTMFCGAIHHPLWAQLHSDHANSDGAMEWERPVGSTTRMLVPDVKSIINVGSVGQPRDRDPRACYVEVCEDRVSWHRVEYEIERAIQAAEGRSETDHWLAERLQRGI